MWRCVNFILTPAIAEGEGDGVLRVCGYLSNLIGFFNLTLNPSPKERDFGIVLEFGFYPHPSSAYPPPDGTRRRGRSCGCGGRGIFV